MVNHRRPERGARQNRREEHAVYGRRDRSRSPRRDRTPSPSPGGARDDGWGRTDSPRSRNEVTGNAWGSPDTRRAADSPHSRNDDPSNVWHTPSGNRSNAGGRRSSYVAHSPSRGYSRRPEARSDTRQDSESAWNGAPAFKPKAKKPEESVWGGAPAFKPKEKKPDEDEWRGAPAFKPKHKKENDETRLQYLLAEHATEDTATDADGKVYAPWAQANTAATPLDMTLENPDLEVSAGIREKFARPEDLLKSELYNTAMKSGSYLMRSQIGGKSIVTGVQKVDNRVLNLNRDGTGYTDGKSQGQVKKRYYEEWVRKLHERDDEIVQVDQIQQEWDNLTQEERDQRLAVRAAAKAYLDPLVRAETVHGMPEEYRVRPGRRYSLRRSRRSARRSASPIRDTEVISDPESVDLFVDDEAPAAEPRPATAPETVTSTPVPETPKNTEIVDAVPVPTISTFPGIVPLADIARRIQHVGEQTKDTDRKVDRYDRIKDLSSEKGRLVAVQLSSDLVEYTRQAITERVSGGTVQELQFFPEHRMVIVGFLHPREAAALLTHINNCQRYSEHEYRRLQIAAEWYRGDEAKAICKYQPYTLFSALIEGITRVLKLTGIHKSLSQAAILLALQSNLPNHNIVKLLLVKPSLRYLQDATDFSNEIIVEFSSMKDASEVKDLIDAGTISDFKSSTTSYAEDPCARTPTTFPWCDCGNCANDTSATTMAARGEGRAEKVKVSKDLKSKFGALRPSDYLNRG